MWKWLKVNVSTIVLTGGSYGSGSSVVEISNLVEGQVARRKLDNSWSFFGERTCATILTRYKSSKVSERDLPSLETGRWEHACGSYNIAQQQVCKCLFFLCMCEFLKFSVFGPWVVHCQTSSTFVCCPLDVDCCWRVQWRRTLGLNWGECGLKT